MIRQFLVLLGVGLCVCVSSFAEEMVLLEKNRENKPVKEVKMHSVYCFRSRTDLFIVDVPKSKISEKFQLYLFDYAEIRKRRGEFTLAPQVRSFVRYRDEMDYVWASAPYVPNSSKSSASCEGDIQEYDENKVRLRLVCRNLREYKNELNTVSHFEIKETEIECKNIGDLLSLRS